MAHLQDIYEIIIIDAPPIISVTDAIILGKKADATLLVVRYGKANREAIIKAKKIFENSKISIAGIIFNDVNLKSAYGYYYKDYYYYSTKEKRKKLTRSGSKS